MNWFKGLLSKFSASTHTIGVVIAGFVSAYVENDTFRNTVNGNIYRALMGHPKLSAVFGGLVAIGLAYKGSHSAKGVQQLASKLDSEALKKSALAADPQA